MLFCTQCKQKQLTFRRLCWHISKKRWNNLHSFTTVFLERFQQIRLLVFSLVIFRICWTVCFCTAANSLHCPIPTDVCIMYHVFLPEGLHTRIELGHSNGAIVLQRIKLTWPVYLRVKVSMQDPNTYVRGKFIYNLCVSVNEHDREIRKS